MLRNLYFWAFQYLY